MNTNKKTYKWGKYEIELGKVYTYKDFPPIDSSLTDQNLEVNENNEQ